MTQKYLNRAFKIVISLLGVNRGFCSRLGWGTKEKKSRGFSEDKCNYRVESEREWIVVGL